MAQQSKKRKQIQVNESETKSEDDQPLRSQQDVGRRSGKEPADEKIAADKALLAMRMSLEKAQLGATKGENDLKEEIAKLKQSLEDAKAERALSAEAANRYLNQKTAAMRTVDFQNTELERRAEEVKELQKTTARLSKEVGEKDQELQTTLMRAQRAEQEMEASEKRRLALEVELQESWGKVASLTEEMRSQSEEVEDKAVDWAIRSIYALRPKNPNLDMSDLPGD
ncbi:coiled-coil domain-containing protein 18-like [Pistacia vera]|uniref:coiled-coil domain-containing protein 18-like n=1 Tax=Pistacia vera TaxID=55513 RepID=UPI0012637641|nr:coiled-coil domain-containing protein 18-like [Pistacia vera]